MHVSRQHPKPQAGIALAAALVLAACSSPKPARAPARVSATAEKGMNRPPAVPTIVLTPSTKATLRVSSLWSRCHETFTVGPGDARAEVSRLAQGCAEVTKMHRVGEPWTGQQAAADKPQTFPWKARAGHCYRAYGAGVTTIKNLDLLLEDSEGVVLGQDGNEDGAPVVLDAGAVCFKVDDSAAVVVSVGDGSGAFAVEVWED